MSYTTPLCQINDCCKDATKSIKIIIVTKPKEFITCEIKRYGIKSDICEEHFNSINFSKYFEIVIEAVQK